MTETEMAGQLAAFELPVEFEQPAAFEMPDDDEDTLVIVEMRNRAAVHQRRLERERAAAEARAKSRAKA